MGYYITESGCAIGVDNESGCVIITDDAMQRVIIPKQEFITLLKESGLLSVRFDIG